MMIPFFSINSQEEKLLPIELIRAGCGSTGMCAGNSFHEAVLQGLCEIFPICDGGCHWVRLKNTNEGKNFDLCSNRKNYITQFLELHYEMKFKKQ